MYITNNRQDAYTNYTVRGEATLLDWLLSNLKESKSKVKATLKNSGIKVNGKFRGTMRIAADVDKDTAIAAALETDIVKRQLANLGGEVRKTIVVPGKLINLIIK